MELNYIKGNKKDFYDFLSFITPRDKVAILSHTDVDGLSSAIFLEKILTAKNIRLDYIDFLDIKPDMMKEALIKLRALDVDKVFVCDIGIDSIDIEGYKELKKEMDLFLIDHHPMNPEIETWENVIKTGSQDCSGMTCYFLGEGLIDNNEWAWLCCSTIFSDFSYKEKKNLDYIQSIYPEVTFDNISTTIPGMNARKINSALIYYGEDKKYVFRLVKNRDMEKITEAHDIVENEIENLVDNFSRDAEHFDSGLHLYEIKSNFKVTSTVCSLISKMKPEDYFVCYKRFPNGTIKFSSRNQGGTHNMTELMRKCTEGLEGASGGGHNAASAALIRVEDFNLFKERLIKTIC